MYEMNSYLTLLRQIMKYGVDINPRGLECKEISDFPLTLYPNHPFTTFIHRKYDVSYFKKEMRWKLTANKYDTSIQESATLWKVIINPDHTYNSNYGQYWFGPSGYNIWDVVMELMRDPDSRKAVIPMLNVSHTAPHVVDTVCTEAVGFRIRNGQLAMSVHMRSSDVIWGLGTDIPTFAFLFRLVKGLLSSMWINDDLITITSMSSHIYSRHYEMVNKILDDPSYEAIEMPYCNCHEAMRIIASRGRKEILQTAGELGEWLICD